MKTIFNKKSLALLFLSASTLTMNAAEEYSPEDKEKESSCWSGISSWFSSKEKKPKFQPEGSCSPLPTPYSYDDDRSCCDRLREIDFGKHYGKASILFGLLAAGLTAALYKLHSKTKSQEFVYYDEKVTPEQSEKEKKELRRLKLWKWLSAGGAIGFGFLAVLSGFKYRKRLKDLNEAFEDWLATQYYHTRFSSSSLSSCPQPPQSFFDSGLQLAILQDLLAQCHQVRQNNEANFEMIEKLQKDILEKKKFIADKEKEIAETKSKLSPDALKQIPPAEHLLDVLYQRRAAQKAHEEEMKKQQAGLSKGDGENSGCLSWFSWGKTTPVEPAEVEEC